MAQKKMRMWSMNVTRMRKNEKYMSAGRKRIDERSREGGTRAWGMRG